MMLSRVADSLYWIGRYLERAENVARLLQVTSDLSVELEGLDEILAQSEWDELSHAIPGGSRVPVDFSADAGLSVPYVNTFLLDAANPLSVRTSLSKARENSRTIREALTREVFVNLNEAHRELERRRRVRDPASGHDLVVSTHQSILTTLGAIEHTLSRDQGWIFMKLGEAIERTSRTALVLRAKLPGLLGEHAEVDVPLVYARWRSLLRGVASLENFRSVHGAQLRPETIVRFLLFDRASPRSIYCGLQRMQGYLDRLRGNREPGRAGRLVGSLVAVFTYEDDRIGADPDPVKILDRVVSDLTQTHEAVSRRYFRS